MENKEKFYEKLLETLNKDNDEFYFKDFCKSIGQGAFGVVKDIFHKNNNKNYVVKIIKKNDDKDITGEEKLTCEINDPHITKIKKIIPNFKYKKNNLNYYYDIIIMEKAKLKDLSNFSKNFKFYLIYPLKDDFGDNILRFFSKQIIEGLEKLERSDYIHLDIKPENILIFDNYNIKLTDFSFLNKC